MKPVIQLFGESFLFTCAYTQTHEYEQFVPEHLVAFQISGETQIYHHRGEMILEEGQILLARGNQFAKSLKIPANDKAYQCVSVLLTKDRLRQFALEHGIFCEERYHGYKNMLLETETGLRDYFLSVLPYLDPEKKISDELANMKVGELILLLLELRPELRTFLFDFSDPHKQNLEEFMVKNYHHNVPLRHFARMSGRSLTSFKRDFAATFRTSPGNWLKEKRLSEAFYLIKKKNHNPRDIYLALGFENLSHFYTAFKKKYGHTPAEIKLQTQEI